MKKNICLFLLFPLWGTAQEQPESYKSSGVFELGPHGANIGYHLRIGEISFLTLETGFGGGYNVNDDTASFVFNFSQPTPYVKSTYAVFYNKKKREEKGKSLRNNAGNFIEVQLKYSFGNKNEMDLNTSLLSEVHWGIQRSIGNNFYFKTHIGIGYLQDFTVNKGNITPTVGAKFGYTVF